MGDVELASGHHPPPPTNDVDMAAPAGMQQPRPPSPIVVETVVLENEQDDDDHDDIIIDTHEQSTAWMVYTMLGFFSILLLWAILLAMAAIHKYGTVAYAGLLVLCCILAGLGLVVHQAVQQATWAQPLNRQLRQAARLVQDEYHAFFNDWKDYRQQLLLEYDGPEHDQEEQESAAATAQVENPSARQSKRKGKKKSILFQAIKPILKIGQKGRMRRRKKKQQHAETAESTYNPPNLV